MKKIASMNLDVVDHVLNDVEKLATLVNDLSDDAKTAYVPSFEEQQDMPDRKFGLILWNSSMGGVNKFAMYSKDLVELNLAFLSDKKDSMPEEVIKIAGANLTKAASDYELDIPNNLEEYKSDVYVDNRLNTEDINELEYVVKCSTATESTYAWADEEKYPLDDASLVKKASGYFDTHHNKMDLSKKLEFVLNTEKAAKEHNVDLNKSTLDKYASLNRSEYNSSFKDHIEIRKTYVKDNDDNVQIYDDLYNKHAELSPTKVAEALHSIDKEFDLTRNYGHGIEDPLMSTLAMIKKAGMEIDGTFITSDNLNSLDEADLTAIVGNDVISELKSDEGVEVLASLPVPVRREVINLI